MAAEPEAAEPEAQGAGPVASEDPSEAAAEPSGQGEVLEPAAVSQGPLVVHEWGTFTARMMEDGKIAEWTVHDRVEPLPGFVNESWTTQAKQAARGTVRMETPVLYFYSEEPRTVSAVVEFPGGFLTEWYPSATHGDTFDLATLIWSAVTLEPGPDPAYPVAGGSHYYAARETDATPLAVEGPVGVEREKMLFYRGVGSFELPLTVAPSRSGKRIELLPAQPLAGVIVLRREGAALGYARVDALDGPLSVKLPALDDSLDDLRAELHALLVGEGLYAREASAMIETWQSLWFDEGLRVLYLVPRARTDELLPLRLEPAPDELVRVMVGRLDLVR